MKAEFSRLSAWAKANWKVLLALALAAIPAFFLIFHKGTQKAASSAISYIPAAFGGGNAGDNTSSTPGATPTTGPDIGALAGAYQDGYNAGLSGATASLPADSQLAGAYQLGYTAGAALSKVGAIAQPPLPSQAPPQKPGRRSTSPSPPSQPRQRTSVAGNTGIKVPAPPLPPQAPLNKRVVG